MWAIFTNTVVFQGDTSTDKVMMAAGVFHTNTKGEQRVLIVNININHSLATPESLCQSATYLMLRQ